MNENQTNESAEQVNLEIVTPSALEALERSAIDVSIATAHKFPRPDLSVIKRKIMSFATLDEETAEGCFYVLPRGGKEIRGPSVRLAEMAITCFGNISAGAREIAKDDKNITVQAVCHDLENNVRIAIEVKRKITDKNGKTYNEDMQTTTGNAAQSIALRNAIFKVIPMALIRPAYDAARKVAIGDAETLGNKRQVAMDYLVKTGATKERILASIGKDSIEDIDLTTLEKLKGIATALKDGEITVDEAFPIDAAKPLFTKKAAEGVKTEAPKTDSMSDEIKLNNLISRDGIKPEELKRALKSFGKAVPAGFKDASDLKDDVLKDAIANWPDYVSIIKGERGNEVAP